MSYRDHISSPLGLVEICASEKGVTSLYFVDSANPVRANEITDSAVMQLQQYFKRERTEFDLELDASGTEFQQTVWQELTRIKYGETCAYQDIANALNNPKAVRAVGAANGRNPISIIVPCHRVIGANGALTGYAGGVDRKAWLLKLEGSLLF